MGAAENVSNLVGSRSVNLSDAGRVMSIVGGGALALYGLSSGIRNRSVPSLALGVIGGGLMIKAAAEKLDADKSKGSNHLPYRGGVVIEKSIVIDKSAEDLYHFWRNFENLPCFMEHLISVDVTGDYTSHWSAKGPAGIPISWDAEIINDIPHVLLAWRSLENSMIDNTGSIQFKEVANGRGTEVKITVRYDPPGRWLGSAFAKLFGEEPGLQVEEDLHRFKELMETGQVAANQSAPSNKVRAEHLAWPKGENPVKDDVTQASEDSFPASDPPSSW